MKRARELFHRHQKSFSRATLTALAATVVDFSTLYLLVEKGGLWYVPSTALGAVAGAVTNFVLNRTWAFESRTMKTHHQGLRYALVSVASLALNTGLVFCFTDYAGLMYLHSKAFAAILVGWGWNYPLHRFYVFPAQADALKERFNESFNNGNH